MQWIDCVPSKSPLNLNPQGDDIGRWSGHEGRALKNEINALMRETPGRSLTLPPREAMIRGSATRKSALTRPCERPDLGLPVSSTKKQLSVVYKPFSQWHFCYATWMDWHSAIHENTGHYEKSGKITKWASIQCWWTCGATGIPPLLVREWLLWKLVWRHLAKPSTGRTLDSAVLLSRYRENLGTQSWETHAGKFKAVLFVIVFKIPHMPIKQ